MKKCPVCHQNYADDSLNFCLNDGSTLQAARAAAPPTVFMNQARATSETNWSNANPPAPWTNQQMSPDSSFAAPALMTVQNQTLPTVSLALGIFSVVLGFCCFAGFPLGAAALITGYLGLNNFNRDPMRYGGRALSIGGMIAGGVGFAISLLLLLITLIKR